MKKFKVRITQDFTLTMIDGSKGELGARYLARNCIARQIPVDSPGHGFGSWYAEPGEVGEVAVTLIYDEEAPSNETKTLEPVGAQSRSLI